MKHAVWGMGNEEWSSEQEAWSMRHGGGAWEGNGKARGNPWAMGK